MSGSAVNPPSTTPAGGLLTDPSVWEGCWFDGTWREASQRIDVIEPATGLRLALVGGASPEEAQEIVAIAAAAQVRMITFTGSTAVGRRVGELAGRNLKKVALELGGNSPLLVLDDCDLGAAVSAGAFGSFLHQGQVCMATSRHIVHRRIAESYIEALASAAARLLVGDPTRPGVAIGPLINLRQRDRVHRLVIAMSSWNGSR